MIPCQDYLTLPNGKMIPQAEATREELIEVLEFVSRVRADLERQVMQHNNMMRGVREFLREVGLT